MFTSKMLSIYFTTEAIAAIQNGWASEITMSKGNLFTWFSIPLVFLVSHVWINCWRYFMYNQWLFMHCIYERMVYTIGYMYGLHLYLINVCMLNKNGKWTMRKNEKKKIFYAIFLHYISIPVYWMENYYYYCSKSLNFLSEPNHGIWSGNFKQLITVKLIYWLKSISFILFVQNGVVSLWTVGKRVHGKLSTLMNYLLLLLLYDVLFFVSCRNLSSMDWIMFASLNRCLINELHNGKLIVAFKLIN